MRTNRRTLLVSLAACGAALAGCTEQGTPDDGGDDTTGDTPDTDPDNNGPKQDDQSSPLADLPQEGYPGDCPDYGDGPVICTDAVVDTPDVDVGTLPALLEADRQSFSDGPVEFVLSNRSEIAFMSNFYDWRLDKQVDGQWYRIAPFEVVEPLMELRSGERHTWSLSVDNAGVESGEPVGTASGTESLNLAGLGGGRYAFRAEGWFEGDGHENSLTLATTVTFDSDPLELVASNRITETSLDGETLVAQSDANHGGDSPPTYVLERGAQGGDPERLITEQVVRSPPLRDAVALAKRQDVDRVRLEAYGASRAGLGRGLLGDFEYRGQSYRLTAEGDE